jgi:hypothetical protein
MSSSEHLPEHLNKALRTGRAIPFLVDHCLESMPGYTLTVLGLIDTRSFEGVFLPDNESADEGMVRVTHPEEPILVTRIRTNSTDAKAIHEFWSLWIGGVVDHYLDFISALSASMSISRINAALETAAPVDGPKPKARKAEPSAKVRAKKRSAAAKPIYAAKVKFIPATSQFTTSTQNRRQPANENSHLLRSASRVWSVRASVQGAA